MKITIGFKGKEHELEVPGDDTIGAVKAKLAPLVDLPPEAQKLFYRGRPRPDADVLALIGVKQFAKLVLTQNPHWKARHAGEAASNAASTSAPTTAGKLETILASVASLELEVKDAVAAGRTPLGTKLRLQELLTQKMLALDALAVDDTAVRERRRQAIKHIDGLCTAVDGIPTEEGGGG